MNKRLLTLVLGAALALGAASCASPFSPSPAESVSALLRVGAADGSASTEEDGLLIPIPPEWRELLTVSTDGSEYDDAHHRTLISVSETASIEAGQKTHPGEDWGDGFLFSIVELDQAGLERYLGFEGSGFEIFAFCAERGVYYLMEHPTDVRLNRTTEEEFSKAMSQWGALCEWADRVPGEILARNDELAPFLVSEYLGEDYRYPGEHRVALYHDPADSAAGEVMIFLSQPAAAGSAGIWCVERVRYVFGGEIYYLPVFPISMGYDVAAADYYARLQAECSAGLRPEMLTPEGALEEFVLKSESWLYGPEALSSIKFLPPVRRSL